jgi:tripeptidyl-peptidase-1
MEPANDTLHLVHQWLGDNGIDATKLRYHPAKDKFKITVSFSLVEETLETEYSVF